MTGFQSRMWIEIWHGIWNPERVWNFDLIRDGKPEFLAGQSHPGWYSPLMPVHCRRKCTRQYSEFPSINSDEKDKKPQVLRIAIMMTIISIYSKLNTATVFTRS